MRIFILSLLVFVLVTSVSLAPAYATRFQGQVASAVWMTVQPGPLQAIMIETNVTAFIFQGTIQEAGNRLSTQFAILTISQSAIDTTTGSEFLVFQGFFGCFPSPDLPPCPPFASTVSFSTDYPNAATQASLVGPLDGFLFGPGGGGPRTIDVALSWTGEGPTHFHQSERTQVGEGTFLTIVNGQVMENVMAMGTISITGVPYPGVGTLDLTHSTPGGPIAPGQGTFLGSFNVVTRPIGR